MPTYKNSGTSFLSLPREIRDCIYTYLLVAPEPICFDAINGSMPAQEIVQCGLILMHPGFISPAVAAEAREVFYRCNTFKIKCTEVLQFLDFTPFQPTKLEDFDPKDWFTSVYVLVERHLAGSNVILSHYPVHFIQKLFTCDNLREIKIEMRGGCRCELSCSSIDRIAHDLKRENSNVRVTLYDSLQDQDSIHGSDPEFVAL